MGRVNILDDNVVNQIAAGEVVERPSSVVKELVENSIDAESTSITVVIENGGRELIEIIDDGIGMSKEDALVAIERFGTSKIKTADDLLSIGSYGFRGEALPSISSVSKFSILTQEKNSQKGVSIDINGGEIVNISDINTTKGCRIKVSDLFFNVPARRRFLKTEKTETGLIKSTIINFSLAYPNIRFKLVSDGVEIINVNPASSLYERALSLKIGAKNPLKVDSFYSYPQGNIEVKGVLSQPINDIKSSSKLRVLVNKRSVRANVITKAVKDGYGAMLKAGRYPHGVLDIEVPKEEVDVNVHPQKSEVRFRSSDIIYRSVLKAVSSSISNRDDVRPLRNEFFNEAQSEILRDLSYKNPSPSSSPFKESITPVKTFTPSFNPSSSPHSSSSKVSFSSPSSSSSSFSPTSKTTFFQDDVYDEKLKNSIWKNYRFLGQILGCFLLMEGEDELVIVDMHAAHERITFFKLMNQFKSLKLSSQRLIIPEVFNVPEEKVEGILIAIPYLESLGFSFNLQNETSLGVLSVPTLLKNLKIKELFEDIISLDFDAAWEGIVKEKMELVIARLACHSSVRSGRILKVEEVYSLLDSLQEVEASSYCPHGRPVMKRFSRYELETLFGRA